MTDIAYWDFIPKYKLRGKSDIVVEEKPENREY